MRIRTTSTIAAEISLVITCACTTVPQGHGASDALSRQFGANAVGDAGPAPTFGIEVQAYPAGVIVGVRGEHAWNERDVLTARLAWNATDRGDFGEHDNEQGGGPGGGLGWRRYFGRQRSGWLIGGRVDVWALRIDWEDRSPTARDGTTDVLVVQPSLEAGHRWRLGDSRWCLDLTGSFGYEINVNTDGEDVGQGPIGLVGATLTFAP